MNAPRAPAPWSRRFDGALAAGLLLLRVAAAAMIWTFHMRPKLAHFDEELRSFPDPIGVGHGASFALALFSEGACSIAVAVGLCARLASLPIIFTMGMVLLLAVQSVEGADVQSALLYAIPYVAIAMTGPGRWSVDRLLAGRYLALWERVMNRFGIARVAR
jgi:putative oxidoreductase